MGAHGIVRVVAQAAHVLPPNQVRLEFVVAAVLQQQELPTTGSQPRRLAVIIRTMEWRCRNQPSSIVHVCTERVLRRDVADLVPHDVDELPLVLHPREQTADSRPMPGIAQALGTELFCTVKDRGRFGRCGTLCSRMTTPSR